MYLLILLLLLLLYIFIYITYIILNMNREAIEQEISRLEDLMADIVISKKTGFVMKNKAKLDKLRKLLKETK